MTSSDADFSGSVTEEDDYTYICLPCETEGQRKRAVGYCINCREYLCQRCYDGHLIPFQMRRHTLVDEDNMTNISTADTTKAKSTEVCPNHKDEIINFHCPSHSFFGCQICFYRHQKECKDVLYIPDVSRNVTGTTEYQEFSNRIVLISDKGSKLISDIQTATETNNTCHEKVEAGIADFKKELLDRIDQLEKTLLKKAGITKQDRSTKLNTLAEKVRKILREKQKIASRIEILLNKHHQSDVYTSICQMKDQLIALEADLRAAESETSILHFEYKSNRDLLETLKSPFGIGTLSETGTITKVEHFKDVNCKTDNDGNSCELISSVFVSDEELILVDFDNAKLKLFDTRQNKIVASITIPPEPYDVCQITDSQVAVTSSSEQKIIFVETKPSLNIIKELKVNGSCHGVGYSEGKLVVSYRSLNKVEILDLQGTVLKMIETDDRGQSIFCGPVNLTVNPYNNLIYVSNNGSDNMHALVVCMKLGGTVVAKYTDSELKGPWQVTTDRSGMVFVSGRTSHNVHQLTEDCKKVKVILTKSQELSAPESIAYNEKAGKMYIGRNTYDLKVFQLHFKQL